MEMFGGDQCDDFGPNSHQSFKKLEETADSCQKTFRRPPHEHQLWPLLQPHRLGCLLLRRWDSKGFPTKPDHLLGGKPQSSEIVSWGSSWCKHAPPQVSTTVVVEFYNWHVYVCILMWTYMTCVYVRAMHAMIVIYVQFSYTLSVYICVGHICIYIYACVCA